MFWVSGNDFLCAFSLLLAPHEEVPLRAFSGEGIESRLVGTREKKLWARSFFRASNGNGFACYSACYSRGRIIQIANQDCFCWTYDNTRRFESDVDPMCTKVTFFCCLVLGIDEDSIVGTRCNTCFTSDTN